MMEMNQVIWFTGLSGAGKTTLANALAKRLQDQGILPVLLDGDTIRALVNQTGFDEASRKDHNRLVGKWANLLQQQGHWVIVSLISPYREVRNEIRQMCPRFIEVYLATPLDECIQRDPKGLYSRALAGEITQFTGISAPYEEPEQPEISINTSLFTQEQSLELLWSYIQKTIK